MLRALIQWYSGKRPASPARVAFRPELEALEDRFVPTTLTVSSLLDNGAAGTLRGAVNQANADVAQGRSDTIVFANKLQGDAITLTRGYLELSASKNNAGITIDGNDVSVSGGFVSNVFVIDKGASVTLDNLTIEFGKAALGSGVNNNGSLFVNNCLFYDNIATQQGGAIYNTGTLAVVASRFSYNSAATGGAIMNWGQLQQAFNTTFDNNVASSGGAAIYNGSQGYVSDCTFKNNHSGGYGGAIANFGSLEVAECSFHDNSAASSGGAIFNGPGELITVIAPTYDDNTAPYGRNFFQD